MRGVAKGAIGTVLCACLFFVASVNAALVIGPTYPLPVAQQGTVTQSGGIGTGAGATWSFIGVVPSPAQQSLWWAPVPNGVQMSFNNGTYSNPGETLTFDSTQSNLATGLVVYTGHTNYSTDGISVQTRFNMTYKVGGNPVALVLASTLGLDASTVAAVLPLTSPASGFTVNMEFFANDGGGFGPAWDVFNNHMLNHQQFCDGCVRTSIGGGYYVDTPPKISNISPASLVIQKSSTSPTVTFTVADVDTAATTLTVTATSSNTAAISNANITLAGTGAARTVKVTSTATTGSTNITLTVSDGLLSSTAVLPVRINAIPILSPVNPLNVNQGGTGTLTTAMLHASDPDNLAAPVTFVTAFLPHDGTLFLNGVPNPNSFTQTDVDNGKVTYTHDNTCNTSDNFGFTVMDVDGGFANDPSQGPGPTSYNFNFNITLAQTAPGVQAASYQVALGGTVSGSLVATSSDCSNPAKTFQVATQPSHGTVSVDTNTGAFTYTATEPGYSGADSFTYTATTYGNMVSAPAAISFDIETKAPIAQSASYNPNEGVAFSGTLVATDANLPPLTLTYAFDALPGKGTVVLNDAHTGSFTYTPAAGQIGRDSFTFNASNGTLISADATITIDIRGTLHSGELVVSDEGDNTHPASIVLFDPLTQQQALVSNDPLLNTSGGGPGPLGIAVAADGKILVATNGKVVRVDPADGSATTFAGGFNFVIGLAVEADGNVLVTDPTTGVIRLDGTTGAQIGTPLSVGAGTAPAGIVVASDTSLYVSDLSVQFANGASNSVFHINADGTGLTMLTTGDHIIAPAGLVLDSGNLFVSNATFGPGGTNDVIQVDTTTGAQIVTTSNGNISDASGIAADATRLYVISQKTAAVIGVDPLSGVQTPLTSAQYLHAPFSIALVPARASVTTITAETPDPSIPGNSYNISVSVGAASGNGVPTGTVTVGDGASGNCTITLLDGAGNCDITTALPGSFTLTAAYAGDDVFGSSTDTASHDVVAFTTTTTITTIAPTTSVVGQRYSVAFDVATASVSPTGTVTVSDDQGAMCGPVTLSGGGGSCLLVSTVAGLRTLTATYAPDVAAFTASSGTSTYNVNPADTAVTISAHTPDPSVPAESITVTASLAVVAPGAGAPSGSILVSADTSESCLIALPATSCSLALGTVGSRSLTATYSGDANFNTSSTSVPHTVEKGSASVSVIASPSTSVHGQSVDFSVTVAALAPASIVPGGSVLIGDGADSCTVTLVLGAGTCAFTPTLVGNLSVTANYGGDGNYATAIGTTTELVQQAQTTTAITSSLATPTVTGQPVTVGFAVAVVAPGAGTLTGNVTVSAGTDSCTAAVAAASCNLVLTSAGAKTMTATYAGDTNFAASTSSGASHTVNPASTTLTIQSQTPDPSTPAQTVTVTIALIIDSPGAGTPTGTINVGDGVNNCTITLPATSCGVPLSTRGARTLTASYAGDANFLASTSGGVAHQVNQLPIAKADAYTLNEGATLTIAAPGVLANDSDPDGNTLSIVNTGAQTASGIGGTVTLNADGSFSYVPPTDTSGVATFTYQVSDGFESVTGTVTLTVNFVNQPPTFTLTGDQNWPAGTAGLETVNNFANVTSFGSPNESGQAITWHVSVSSDPNGVTNGVQILDDGTLIYSLSGQSGTALISVIAQDNGGTANGGNDTAAAQTFQITVGGGLDLAIGMTGGADFLNGGMPVDYTIIVQNIGTTDAHNATVQNQLPGNLLGATWTCETIGAATCTASGSGDIDDTVNIPKNGGLIYHLTATVQAIPEMPVVNTATVAAQTSEADIRPANNTVTLTDLVGIFRDSFETASSVQIVTATTASAKTQIVALDVARAISGRVLDAEPVLVAVVRNDSDQRAAVVHVRSYREQTQARLSWRGDDGLWRAGEWIAVKSLASLQLAWTTDRGLSSPAASRISLVEVELLLDQTTLGRIGEEL